MPDISLDYRLGNDLEQPVLHLTGNAQTLALTLKNVGAAAVPLPTRLDGSDVLELCFRPGTLNRPADVAAADVPLDPGRPASPKSSEIWQAQSHAGSGHLQCFRIARRAAAALAPGESARVVLGGFQVRADHPAAVIQVQLRWSLGGSSGTRLCPLGLLPYSPSELERRAAREHAAVQALDGLLQELETEVQALEKLAGDAKTPADKIQAEADRLRRTLKAAAATWPQLTVDEKQTVRDMMTAFAGAAGLGLRLDVVGSTALYDGGGDTNVLDLLLRNVSGGTLAVVKDVTKLHLDLAAYDQNTAPWGALAPASTPTVTTPGDTDWSAHGQTLTSNLSGDLAADWALHIRLAGFDVSGPPGPALLRLRYEDLGGFDGAAFQNKRWRGELTARLYRAAIGAQAAGQSLAAGSVQLDAGELQLHHSAGQPGGNPDARLHASFGRASHYVGSDSSIALIPDSAPKARGRVETAAPAVVLSKLNERSASLDVPGRLKTLSQFDNHGQTAAGNFEVVGKLKIEGHLDVVGSKAAARRGTAVPSVTASAGVFGAAGGDLVPDRAIALWQDSDRVPAGWALCDGHTRWVRDGVVVAIERDGKARMLSTRRVAAGDDLKDTLKVDDIPDLRSRFIVGAQPKAFPLSLETDDRAKLTRYDLGSTRDDLNHVGLTHEQMPAHRHPLTELPHRHTGVTYFRHNWHNDRWDNNHWHEGWCGMWSSEHWVTRWTRNNHWYSTPRTDFYGVGRGHENRPPYVALCFIQKMPRKARGRA